MIYDNFDRLQDLLEYMEGVITNYVETEATQGAK
jgi:hypothetical protein